MLEPFLKKIFRRAGKKEGVLGEGIFARPPLAWPARFRHPPAAFSPLGWVFVFAYANTPPNRFVLASTCPCARKKAPLL